MKRLISVLLMLSVLWGTVSLTAFSQSSDTIIGSFEKAFEQDGWSVRGDVRLVSSLGELQSPEGAQMAMITTGLGAGTQAYLASAEGSVLSRTIEVPDGAKTLSFAYNFVSEEPMEFLGSPYDDKFIAEIICGNDTTSMLNQSINTANWNPVAGVDFDGGDRTAYQTTWETVHYDISAFAGKEITICFIVSDVGDSLFDTVALVDNVAISDQDVTVGANNFKHKQIAVSPIKYFYNGLEFYKYAEPSAILSGLTDALVPQGIAYREDTKEYYISNYVYGGSSSDNSVIIVIDALTNKQVGEYYLYNSDGSVFTGHAGGVAISQNNLFVANGKKLAKISLETIDTLGGIGNLQFEEEFVLPIGAAGVAFCNYENGVLWIGNFWESTNYPSYAYDGYKTLALGYVLDESNGSVFKASSKVEGQSYQYLPDYICAIPEKTQGIAVASDGTMIISQSYGRASNSSILIGTYPQSENTITLAGKEFKLSLFTQTRKLAASPMSEGIDFADGKLVTLFESGAKVYREGGAVEPTDRLWLMDINKQ